MYLSEMPLTKSFTSAPTSYGQADEKKTTKKCLIKLWLSHT